MSAAAIRIDPETGRKIFHTRAAKATDKIAGKGYSIVTDKTLTTLPEPPPGAAFNADEQAKYREYKEERRGAADYIAMEGEFAKYLEDVYSEPPIPRDAPVTRATLPVSTFVMTAPPPSSRAPCTATRAATASGSASPPT